MRHLQPFTKEPRTCPNCQEILANSDSYCGMCGSFISNLYNMASTVSTDYHLAGFERRVLARIIDFLFLFILASIIFRYLFPEVRDMSVEELFQLDIPVHFFFIVDTIKFSSFFVMTQWRGQTLGKMVLRLSVVDNYGNRPTVRMVALREFSDKFLAGSFMLITLSTYLNLSADMQMNASFLHLILLITGYICVMLNRHKRAWHDYLSKTLVIQRPSTRI